MLFLEPFSEGFTREAPFNQNMTREIQQSTESKSLIYLIKDLILKGNSIAGKTGKYVFWRSRKMRINTIEKEN